MNTEILDTNTKSRQFLPQDFSFDSWADLQPYFDILRDTEISDEKSLKKWLLDRSELESYLSENFAWRYIRMTCDTANEDAQKAYQFFLTDIHPQASPYDDLLNKKAVENQFLETLQHKDSAWQPLWLSERSMKRAIEIFREENIPLQTEIQQLSSEYQAINGAMTVELDGKKLTLQQAAARLENPDRAVREATYEAIQNRRLQDRERLDELFDKLIKLRQQIAQNAGFANYRDYMFAAMGRFDYTPQDCFDFHEAVAQTTVPLLDEATQERKKALNLSQLRPWDKAVDTQNRKALKPFENGEDLLNRTIECFTLLDPFLGDCLRVMKNLNRLDLESRIGKAPGGYNYPLEETGFPFIFMNAASQLRDMVTLLHEGGHAVHSILTKDLSINAFRQFPAEVAELASMSMELLTMDYWHVFFENEEDLKRAKIKHLEDIIETLPWVATIDKFQHWIYENPTHTLTDRQKAWNEIYGQFSDKTTDWTGLEDKRTSLWHKQLHVFELPFYYIEYGIAQLGAIGVWKNYKQNPKRGLEGYLNALKIGYTKPMREVYEAAYVPFDFSKENIASLMNFVKEELKNLRG
jgi:oligoendopeptidase F